MTAPAPEEVEMYQDETGLSHKWCRCRVPAQPLPATAFCGFVTTKRRTGLEPPMPPCAVCTELAQYPCEGCGR